MGFLLINPYHGAYYYDEWDENVDEYLRQLPDWELAELVGNGTQSCQKVMLARYGAFQLLTGEQVNVYYTCIDRDQDGTMSYEDFCSEYGCYGDPGNRFPSMEAAEEAFAGLDTNGDGDLQPGEFDQDLGDEYD